MRLILVCNVILIDMKDSAQSKDTSLRLYHRFHARFLKMNLFHLPLCFVMHFDHELTLEFNEIE